MRQAAIFLLMLTACCRAGEIRVPEQIAPYTLVRASYEPTEGMKSYAWFVTSPALPGAYVDICRTDKLGEICFTGPPGTYYVMAVALTIDGALDQAQATVVIGANPPTPPVPPNPPPPAPTSKPRVLILEETSQRTPETGMIVGSTSFRKFLWDNTEKLSDGTGGYRIWDDDYTDLQQAKMGEFWRQAYQEAIKSSSGVRPWLEIWDGRQWHGHPLPDTSEKVQEIIRRHVPNAVTKRDVGYRRRITRTGVCWS